MAANVTPVKLEVKDFEEREVILVDYKFNQSTDVEGQISGIPRGGKVTIRVKAMNDGNNQLLQWMLAPNDPRDMKVTVELLVLRRVEYCLQRLALGQHHMSLHGTQRVRISHVVPFQLAVHLVGVVER